MADRASAGVTWARVEKGFFVASCGGEFVGYIDQSSPDAFIVCDKHAKTIACASELAIAMALLVDSTRAEGARDRGIEEGTVGR